MNDATFYILLVEDDRAHAELVRLAVQECRGPCALIWMVDGEEAMRYLHREGRHALSHRPDLILLDLKLPGMDGQEVLRRIKCNLELFTIPVVVFSASAAQSVQMRTIRCQASGFLTKPTELDDFIGAIRRTVEYWRCLERESAQNI
jgi:CheY-like chemotaxis protein